MHRVIPLLLLLALSGCATRLHREVVAPNAAATVDRKAPFLKVHMRDGSVFVLSPWTVDDSLHVVTGTGTRYDAARTAIGDGSHVVAIDSVALFETNVARPSESVAALAVVTGISAGLTVYCAANTKACFGSCPTFYVTDGTRDVLQAEGFSASVAPSLEAVDVDALYRARARNGELRIDMVNEAYETHVVRHADVLAVPRRPGHRVFSDDAGGFWSVPEPRTPARCTAAEGDCAAILASFDERERSSAADSTDLAARETIDLVFAPTAAPALVLASRQSLLPTYLLYQAFAYLGTSVGHWLAAFERADPATAQRAAGLVAALGGIDVLVPDGGGGWDSVATIRETGPLASDVRLIPLPATSDSVRVRLRVARGAWRLDAVGLTSVIERVTPVRLAPASVLDGRGSPAPAARAALHDPARTLVTFPGDRYTLVYRLPDRSGDFELFLETKGYYLEWMREEWLAEENAMKAAALFLDPAGSLRRLAGEFKRQEPALEQAFWGSKYAAP